MSAEMVAFPQQTVVAPVERKGAVLFIGQRLEIQGAWFKVQSVGREGGVVLAPLPGSDVHCAKSVQPADASPVLTMLLEECRFGQRHTCKLHLSTEQLNQWGEDGGALTDLVKRLRTTMATKLAAMTAPKT